MAGTAVAATYTFSFSSDFCDRGALRTRAGSPEAAARTHTSNNCVGGTSEGQGLLAKVRGLGKVYSVSDTIFGKNYGILSEQISWILPVRPTNGAPWTLWVGVNGVSSFEENSGVLTQVTKGTNHIHSTGTRRTTSSVRQMLATFRKSPK